MKDVLYVLAAAATTISLAVTIWALISLSIAPATINEVNRRDFGKRRTAFQVMTISIFAALLIGLGTSGYSATNALLFWIPASWGSHDEDGSWVAARASIAFLGGAISALGGVTLLFSIAEKLAELQRFHAFFEALSLTKWKPDRIKSLGAWMRSGQLETSEPELQDLRRNGVKLHGYGLEVLDRWTIESSREDVLNETISQMRSVLETSQTELEKSRTEVFAVKHSLENAYKSIAWNQARFEAIRSSSENVNTEDRDDFRRVAQLSGVNLLDSESALSTVLDHVFHCRSDRSAPPSIPYAAGTFQSNDVLSSLGYRGPGAFKESGDHVDEIGLATYRTSTKEFDFLPVHAVASRVFAH